ncbi:MAG: protocatechuate 3,4-dioxygenase subunit alpha [Chloroflexi bacterium]|nr:protocatechuate 3,4-dioxygenase subunit alpha [Chloroflexota bacterium]
MTTPTKLGLTSSQTVGPFFSPALLREEQNLLCDAETTGERIRIEGRVLDGAGDPVPDALVEIWQANEHGRYNHPLDQRDLPLDPRFTGFGRSGADDDGRYWFETIKPGPVPFDDGRMQAPHLVVTIFARGLLNHAVTRLYFADDAATADDPILALVPKARRQTLLAQRSKVDGETVYRLDLVLQGAAETVFFNL